MRNIKDRKRNTINKSSIAGTAHEYDLPHIYLADERYSVAKCYGLTRPGHPGLCSGVLYLLLNKIVEYKSATQGCFIHALLPGTKKIKFLLLATHSFLQIKSYLTFNIFK